MNDQDLTTGSESEAASAHAEEPTLVEARALGGRGALRLAFVLVIVVALAYQLHILGTLVVVAAIVAMIMIHEFGHFFTAKLSGMKVTEYFLGFGPRIWSFRRGETEYGVKALPLGGYVKIVGMATAEEVPPEDEARTYRESSFPRRLAVSVAGSFMHFVMALVLIFVVLVGYGYADPHVIAVGGVASFTGQRSPAQVAGLRSGDVILSVDGKPVHSVTTLSSTLGDAIGKPVSLSLDRHGRIISTSVTPVDGKSVKFDGQPYLPSSAKARGVIGISLVAGTTHPSVIGAIGRSFTDLGSFSWQTVTALFSHFSPHGIAQYAAQLVHPSTNPASAGAQSRFASPVGIVRLASQAAQAGVETVLGLLISINIFVGIFNLVPLLPLDGGHVVIAIYERIRSRKGRAYHVDIFKLMPLTYVVIGVLVVLSVTALYLDLTHPIGNPFG